MEITGEATEEGNSNQPQFPFPPSSNWPTNPALPTLGCNYNREERIVYSVLNHHGALALPTSISDEELAWVELMHPASVNLVEAKHGGTSGSRRAMKKLLMPFSLCRFFTENWCLWLTHIRIILNEKKFKSMLSHSLRCLINRRTAHCRHFFLQDE